MYDQLMKVSKGFKLVYIGIVIIIVGVIGGVLGACVVGGAGAAAGGGKGAAALVMVIAGLMMLCILGGTITGLVGRFFCLAVPERAGAAKPMIVISVILEVTGLVLGVVNSASDLAGGQLTPAAKMVLQGGNVLCSLTSAVLFLLFTRSVALFVRRRDLAATAMSVLWLWVATILCYGAGLGIMLVGILAGGGAAAAGGGPKAGAGAAVGGACIGLVVILVALILALVALVRYIGLLKGMSAATAQHARRTRKKYEEEEDEYDDEEEEEEYDDEEEEDDRPRRRSRRRDEDDYDDEEDDRPRRPRKW